MRLDQAIASRYPDISRRKARELLAGHRVLVNDRPVSVASREISDTDRIAIVDGLPDIGILRETAGFIAVDKPTGLPVQPERERVLRSALEILQLKLKREGKPHDLFVVHRIDTGTSGVVLFARTRAAAAKFSRFFADREVRKTYMAVVDGVIDTELRIDQPIEGREALSIVRPQKRIGERTLVECDLITGRTHQLRIHLASAGHPITGDSRYGGSAAARLMLHAASIHHESFGTIEAPLPAGFR